MSHTADPFDELAALFLTGPDEAAARQHAAPIVELLVVGHLPVRADLWLTPYADKLARSEGPGAIVRLDGDQPTLQLVRADGALSLPGMDDPEAGPPAAGAIDLGEAARRLAGSVARWIVRPPGGAGALELLEAGADRITVLTSVDELARVRAFERLKTIAEAARRHGITLPPIGIAVIGAERQTAQEIAMRIRQVAVSALGIDLELVACVERIDAAVRAGDRVDLSPVALTLRSLVDSVRSTANDGAATRPRPEPAERSPGDFFREAPPAPAPAPERPAVARVPPKPAVELEAKHPVSAREPDQAGAPLSLCRFVDGLTCLPVRCPTQERLELGLDAGGRLHVMAREPDMRGLHRVRAWARAHRELIAMACRDRWIDPAAEPVCHVFTDRPAALADLHESGLRLHVLAPVLVEGRQGWYYAPLNADVR